MKKRNKVTETNFSRLVDTELSAYIQKQDISYKEGHQKTAVKLSVMDFKKMVKTAKIRDFIGSLITDYQYLVDYTNSKLVGDVQKLRGQSHISDSNDEIINIDRKITQVDDKIAPLKGKFDDAGKRHRTVVRKWFYFFIPILILIATMELISNFDALDSLGGSKISSFGMAILTGICVYWYSHFIPDKIRKYGQGKPKRELLLFFLFLIPIVIVFYFFSMMRIQYMTALNQEMAEIYNTSPLVFTIVNAFAYTISTWIILAFKPTQEVILAYKKYLNDVKEIQKLETIREDLCQQKSAINPELREKLTDRFQILLLGKQTEDEIVTRMRGCFELFKMELYLKTNGTCEVLFTGDVEKDLPKLKLNYQNLNEKFPTNEK
ncbi:hypothetical protein [Polaribacter glomeratus]|uniref:Uncharacterized protein n=1 Tax=Polaribacter glomeratus TaxID=102 RepID=A0A2S7WFV7_9FLAO|nr:hypothetical protein [Polaribacter glomeratus]PQJ76495.1 hypothetical protein BTO16_11355 [Polaribacter glomeratus]TXD64208.1 hypothetical protein ESX12_15970 [Polaribacter glomeratus]